MGNAAGISWSVRGRRRAVAVIAMGGMLVGGALAPVAHADTGTTGATSAASTTSTTRVIIRFNPGANAAGIIAAHGGTIVETMSSLSSALADVPTDVLDELRLAAGVVEVSEDTALQIVQHDPEAVPSAADVADGRANPIHFVADDFGKADSGNSFDALTVDALGQVIGADTAHKNGATGAGVDVAIIDTGIAPVAGLGTVINGADLSFESQNPEIRHLDTNGHGTHLAGIISGLAPDSRLVNVKVGAFNGAADVSQVIAAIDWVVQHRNDNGMNIRVLNLAYGTQNSQGYTIDPLAHAAEVAWRHGIVVVTAAGNAGTQFGRLTNPAVDPYVLAVGASESHGTFSTADDTVAAFSSRGSSSRPIDLVAPGRSVVSLRTPGSLVDDQHPEGIVDATSFRGSGTSQSAAVTSAAAALLLDHQPGLTADEVKAALKKSAKKLPTVGSEQGAGIIDVHKAMRSTPSVQGATQTWPVSTGTGTLEGARGTSHIEHDGVPLTGEVDIFGNPWDGASWSGASWSGASWSGGEWNGASWSGASWSGASWSGASWSGASWSGASWSGASWSGASWSGASWSGASWSGASWSGASWSGASWSGASWSGASWSGASWSGASWS